MGENTRKAQCSSSASVSSLCCSPPCCSHTHWRKQLKSSSAHPALTTLLDPSPQAHQLWQILYVSVCSSEYTSCLGWCHSCIRGLQQTTYSQFRERPGAPGHNHFSQEYQHPYAVLTAWFHVPWAWHEQPGLSTHGHRMGRQLQAPPDWSFAVRAIT